MEDSFSNISLEKILAALFIGALLFYSSFKENLMMNKKEKEHLEKIGNRTNNKLSGKTLMAIFYFSLIAISLCLAIILYKNIE